jgi:hypothetical protein
VGGKFNSDKLLSIDGHTFVKHSPVRLAGVDYNIMISCIGIGLLWSGLSLIEKEDRCVQRLEAQPMTIPRIWSYFNLAFREEGYWGR